MKLHKIERDSDPRIIVDLTEKEGKILNILLKKFCLSLGPKDLFFQEEDLAKAIVEKLDALQNPKT